MRPDGLSDTAFRLNSVAIHLVRRARTADEALRVPPGQLSALSVLVFGGERTIAQLAEAEQVTSPTITRIVDGLERAGLAQRHPHPDDGRATLVRATSKGRRLMERGRQRRVDLLTSLLERLSKDEVDAVAQAANALARSLSETS
ncbi:MAG TPA: MarR family transcriptional regulator [Acidimicrobiales bacterium]|nr:MarR family transcriptional regulator [Acidimicrobiales bacterium]